MLFVATVIMFALGVVINVLTSIALSDRSTLKFLLNFSILSVCIVSVEYWWDMSLTQGLIYSVLLSIGSVAATRWISELSFIHKMLGLMKDNMMVPPKEMSSAIEDPAVWAECAHKYPTIFTEELKQHRDVFRLFSTNMSYLGGNFMIVKSSCHRRVRKYFRKRTLAHDSRFYILTPEAVAEVCKELCEMR